METGFEPLLPRAPVATGIGHLFFFLVSHSLRAMLVLPVNPRPRRPRQLEIWITSTSQRHTNGELTRCGSSGCRFSRKHRRSLADILRRVFSPTRFRDTRCLVCRETHSNKGTSTLRTSNGANRLRPQLLLLFCVRPGPGFGMRFGPCAQSQRPLRDGPPLGEIDLH